MTAPFRDDTWDAPATVEASHYADDDLMPVGLPWVGWCDECGQNTGHGDFCDEDGANRMQACTVCRLVVRFGW